MKAKSRPPAQFEQRFVFADQNIGAATRGQFQEFLVILILATWQVGRFTGRNQLDQAAVALVTLDHHFRRHLQLRISQHALQFIQRAFIGKAFDAATFKRRHDRHGIGIGPMVEVENNVGIKDESQHGADYNAGLCCPRSGICLMSRIILAPMEGLADDLLRGVLTRIGGYDWGICEFIRVSANILPIKTYQRMCPELLNNSLTEAGTPMRVQLLGSDPYFMAENARRLVTLQPAGVDLNFGCPAPTVNRHRGGAALLGEPELLNQIASAVRAVVPVNIPFTAKMRLGINDTSRAVDCAQALQAAGIDELIVHGRTKLDGYRPPARWEWIDKVRAAITIPLIANGEVWTVEDFVRCQAETGCPDIMLGRGAIADPLLARRVRGEAVGGWAEVEPGVAAYWLGVRRKVVDGHAGGRIKQWLALLRRAYPEAEVLYQRVRTLKTASEIDAALLAAGILTESPLAA